MKLRNLFILNLKTFVIDLIIFVIGFYFYWNGINVDFEPSFLLSFVGLILILISITHLVINLIMFIYRKFKKKRK